MSRGTTTQQENTEEDEHHDLSVPDTVSEEISELLAGYALDALSEEDTAFIESYLPDRPAWRRELSQFQQVAGMLPYAAQPRPVPVRAKAKVLERIDALAIESQEEAIARAHSPFGIVRRIGQVRDHVPKVAWAAALPTTALAVIFIMASILMQERISDQQSELAAYQQEQVRAGDVLLADNNRQQVVEMVQSTAAPLARGRLFIDQDENTAMLVVRDMPQPAEGQNYVVWLLIGSGLNEHAKLGELQVDALGRGQMILDPPDNFDHYPVVRITIEAAGESGPPIGPEIMTGGIR